MTTYRTGRHWGVTIVQAVGRDANDQIVAVVVNGDLTLAARICALLNEEGDGVIDCLRCGEPIFWNTKGQGGRQLAHWQHADPLAELGAHHAIPAGEVR